MSQYVDKKMRYLVRLSVALALGVLPATAAFALGGNEVSVVPAQPIAGQAAFCAGGPGQPMGIPLEPQSEVMKGAPYSGVGTTEVVTTLADGNRITRTNTMRYFRDGVGRTRTEYQLAAIGPFVPEEAQSIVTITDPVGGKQYVLHPGMKRADVFKIGPNGVRTAGGAVGNAIFVGGAFASVNGSAQRVGGGQPGLMPSQQPQAGAQFRMEGPKPGSSRGTDRAPKMTGPGIFGSTTTTLVDPSGNVVTHTTTDGAPPPPPPGVGLLVVNNGVPMPGCRGGAMKAAEPVSIGERRIEGLKVTGSRLEFTLDAGAVGNEQPITVRTDQWFSPDLGVVVSSTNHDPMLGDTTYRLEQINRVEPEANLFVVPADYTKNPVGF